MARGPLGQRGVLGAASLLGGVDALKLLGFCLQAMATPEERLALANRVRQWADDTRRQALDQMGESDESDPTETYTESGRRVEYESEFARGPRR